MKTRANMIVVAFMCLFGLINAGCPYADLVSLYGNPHELDSENDEDTKPMPPPECKDGIYHLHPDSHALHKYLEPVLLIIYEPESEKFKEFEPMIEEIKARFADPIRKEQGFSQMNIAMIDGSLDEEFSTKMRVKDKGYKLSYSSHMTAYGLEKPRKEEKLTIDIIIGSIDQSLGPHYDDLSQEQSCSELAKYIKNKDFVDPRYYIKQSQHGGNKYPPQFTLLYFGDVMGDLDFHAFKNMYSNNHLSKEFRFIHAPKDCANEYGAPVPGYALLRDNNSTAVVRGGGYDYSTITNWAIDHQLTNLVKWDIDMYEYVFAQTKKEVLILFTETEEQYDEKDVMLGEFSKLANSGLPITNEAVFAYSRNTSVAFNQTIKYMQVERSELPTLRLLDLSQAQPTNYAFSGNLSNIEEIIQFHTDFKNGLIDPVLKSEPIPTDQNETDSLVKTVVGKNFDEIVRDSSKDVFVEFYAPWCSHCKKVEPAWEELAGHYANTDDVVIARMDATANKVKDLNLSGYPSFKFYGKDDKNGVDYKGKHDMNELNNFLREKSTAAANTVLKVDL